jgi:hypothetical protein
MNMPMDYEVFEPNDEHLARIIVRILEKKGYNAGYQLGYPNNKVFIKVDAKEDADRISGIIRKFTEKFRLTGSGLTTDEFNTLISKLSSLIPETPKRKQEKPAKNIEKKIENKDYGNSKISESEIYHNAKLEELRSKIVERLNLLTTLMETPNDPSNEKRKIESETLVWVLQNMP